MALPRAEVVSAILESYINSRKKDWGIQGKKEEEKEDEQILLPTAKTPANKIRVCIDIIREVQKAKTYDDWINVIYLCANKEKKETEEFAWRYGFITPVLEKLHLINKDAWLALFIHAALTHAISKLVNHAQFSTTKEDLQKAKNENQKAIEAADTHGGSAETKKKLEAEKLDLIEKIAALENSKDYPNNFFNDYILPNDPIAARLNEESFADFEQNALSGKRPLTMYKKLMVVTNENKSDTKEESVTAHKNAEALQSLGAFKVRKENPNHVSEDNIESSKSRHTYNLRQR